MLFIQKHYSKFDNQVFSAGTRYFFFILKSFFIGLSWTTFCDPLAGQTLRSDSSGAGGNVGTLGVTAACSAILGGPIAAPTHTNNANLSVILMGDTNTINTFIGVNGTFNTIANGHENQISGSFSSILNGETNNICGEHNLIGSGFQNKIGDTPINSCPASFSFIGGGSGNFIRSDIAVTNYK